MNYKVNITGFEKVWLMRRIRMICGLAKEMNLFSVMSYYCHHGALVEITVRLRNTVSLSEWRQLQNS